MARKNQASQRGAAEGAEGAAAEGAEGAEGADSELITMYKPGQPPIDVHPTCVKAHVAAGWSRTAPEGDDEE